MFQETPVALTIPPRLNFKVIEDYGATNAPSSSGATQFKSVLLDTKAELSVPEFVKVNDVVISKSIM